MRVKDKRMDGLDLSEGTMLRKALGPARDLFITMHRPLRPFICFAKLFFIIHILQNRKSVYLYYFIKGVKNFNKTETASPCTIHHPH